MAKRDPLKTARNKVIKAMKDELRSILPKVLKETGIKDEASLNAIIGHKTDRFIDLKNEIINTPEHYVILWMEGFKEHLSTVKKFRTSYDDLFDTIKASPNLQEYLNLFLRRSYLKHYDELHKRRPKVDEAEVWIGHNNADYGLLITPRFSGGDWENDKSEIRHFKPLYWTIGHVLKAGLVIPGKNDRIEFPKVDDYLKFFEHVLVRATASPHQKEVAKRYSEYVRKSTNPESVPLLIPEFRYEGRTAKHKYRLDFCIIDPSTFDRVGFELSPWSTHGELKGTKEKSQKEINEIAKSNFEKEMRKHRSFFRKHGVFTLIYTDENLANPDALFADISGYLVPKEPAKQLSFNFIKDFFK